MPNSSSTTFHSGLSTKLPSGLLGKWHFLLILKMGYFGGVNWDFLGKISLFCNIGIVWGKTQQHLGKMDEFLRSILFKRFCSKWHFLVQKTLKTYNFLNKSCVFRISFHSDVRWARPLPFRPGPFLNVAIICKCKLICI
jgi:hypothetical protein